MKISRRELMRLIESVINENVEEESATIEKIKEELQKSADWFHNVVFPAMKKAGSNPGNTIIEADDDYFIKMVSNDFNDGRNLVLDKGMQWKWNGQGWFPAKEPTEPHKKKQMEKLGAHVKGYHDMQLSRLYFVLQDFAKENDISLPTISPQARSYLGREY